MEEDYQQGALVTSFKKILPIKKSTSAAQQILDAIRSGEYPVGETLPPERVLASEMDASRSCIREALSILHGLGIVETRRSDGTYVRKLVKNESLMEQAQEFVKQTEDLIQVWEARKQIETVLVSLAIARKTTRALKETTESLEQMQNAASKKDLAAYRIANTEFHLGIAKISGNGSLINALQSLLQVTTNHVLERISSHYIISSMHTSLEKHEAILGAIADEDEIAASTAVEFHFQDLLRHITKRLQELPDGGKDPLSLPQRDLANRASMCKQVAIG